jgi:hypothetical protein
MVMDVYIVMSHINLNEDKVGSKVIKITIQLVKSYDFTSQYRLNMLNRS